MTDRHRETEKTDRQREMDRYLHRQTDEKTMKQRQRHTEKHGHRDRKTDRQTRHTQIQIHKQTDRQAIIQ